MHLIRLAILLQDKLPITIIQRTKCKHAFTNVDIWTLSLDTLISSVNYYIHVEVVIHHHRE